MLDKTFQDTWKTRDNRLSELNMTYDEFLKSEHWSSIKEKAKSRNTYLRCRVCGTDENIELHHSSYKWIGTADELRSVLPICRKHHIKIHNLAKETNISVRLATNSMITGTGSLS